VTALADFVPRALTTTAFRLAATSVAAFVIATAAIVFTLFWQTNALLTEHVVSGLRDETAELVAESRSGDLAALAAKVQAKSRPDGRALYILLGPAGEKLAGNLNRVPPELLDSPQGGVFRYDAGSDPQGRSERLAVAIQADLEGGAKLVVGRDIEDQRGYAARVKTIFFAGFGLLALTGLLAGLGVSRSVLKRIEDITQTSRSIMAGDLARRVPVRGTGGGELDDLAASLNAMLERIEQLMNGLREVSDNIAHDLKTPLNRLRNRAEAALRDARGAQAYKEGLEQTIEEADELIKTFNALLLIARLEAGAIEESAERFDIGALVADVAELYQPVAEEEGLEIDIDAESGLIIEANRQLVSQAVANLVDNAIKYGTRAKGGSLRAINVRVAKHGDFAELSVADHGPGIPACDRERALKRFVRLEASRTRPGTGLGLSLVAAVARLHRGTVRLEDNAPGLCAIVALPLASPVASAGAAPRG
jgi:signal transduction histidine kinase